MVQGKKKEYTKTGRDGMVRELCLSHGHKDDEDDWIHYTVERPVRTVSKLMNVEDVYKMCKQILLK